MVSLSDNEKLLVNNLLSDIHKLADPNTAALMTGGAWYSSILDKVKKTDTGKLVLGNIPFYDRISQAITGPRQDLRPQDRKLVATYGSKTVTGVVIGRKPIFDWIHTALGVLSLGKWQELMKKYGFDKFFHLFLIISLDDGTKIKIEKNEVITLTKNPKVEPGTELLEVGRPPNQPTLSTWLERTKKLMGDKFYNYDALGGNNCQNFVMSMLQANGQFNPETKNFVYQDITELSRDLDSFTRKFAKSITDLAARANVIVHGKGAGMMMAGADPDMERVQAKLGYKLFKWLFTGLWSKLQQGAEQRARERRGGAVHNRQALIKSLQSLGITPTHLHKVIKERYRGRMMGGAADNGDQSIPWRRLLNAGNVESWDDFVELLG